MTGSMVQHYVKLTEFLGKVLGPDFEIALHDLSDQNNSIIAISNGHVSGRTIGAPLNDSVMQVIAERRHKTEDFRFNFSGIAANSNKMLRSSALFIKDDDGKLAGLMCINFDDSRYRDISERILRLRPPSTSTENNFVCDTERVHNQPVLQPGSENFFNSINSLTESAITRVMGRSGVPVDRLTLSEKMRIISILEEKGVFMLKGAVKLVAQRLSCSQASVYRYLNRVSNEKGADSTPPV